MSNIDTNTLIEKSALEISQLWPPNRNEVSKYANIWWGNHHLCYSGERPTTVFSGEVGHFRQGFNFWVLKEYLESGNTIWKNPHSQCKNAELIEVQSNGSFYFSYIDKEK